MKSLIAHVSNKKQFLADLNYLNLDEIKSFCKRHAIPYYIHIEMSPGIFRATRECDRKGILLERVRQYLQHGVVPPPTQFASTVVAKVTAPKRITADTQLFYGHYDKKNEAMMALLAKLTHEQYKDGAIARILLNEFWRKGEAPTFATYANAWLAAKEAHLKPNSEWAFLADRSAGKDTSDWKLQREQKAKALLEVLNKIPLSKA